MKNHTPAQRARNNKARGKTLERDAVALAKSFGFTAQRGWGSDGRAMGEHQEVDIKIEDYKFQCKRKVKFPDWLQRNNVVDGHIIRQDNEVAMVVIPLKFFLALLTWAFRPEALPRPQPVDAISTIHI